MQCYIDFPSRPGVYRSRLCTTVGITPAVASWGLVFFDMFSIVYVLGNFYSNTNDCLVALHTMCLKQSLTQRDTYARCTPTD